MELARRLDLARRKQPARRRQLDQYLLLSPRSPRNAEGGEHVQPGTVRRPDVLPVRRRGDSTGQWELRLHALHGPRARHTVVRTQQLRLHACATLRWHYGAVLIDRPTLR